MFKKCILYKIENYRKNNIIFIFSKILFFLQRVEN